jgi:drug/metabolite transporter (DMT)-like permease
MVLCIHWYTFFATINIASVTVALLTLSCFPIFLILMKGLVKRQGLAAKDLFSALMIIAGIFVMVPKTADTHVLPGWAWGFASAILFAVLTLQNELLVKHYNTFQISFAQNAVACLILSCATIRPDLLTNLSFQQWGLLALCGVFCTAGAHTMLIKSFDRIPAIQISFLVNLEPIYSIALAFVLLNEPISASALLGGGLVITAIILNTILHQRAAHKRTPPHPEPIQQI